MAASTALALLLSGAAVNASADGLADPLVADVAATDAEPPTEPEPTEPPEEPAAEPAAESVGEPTAERSEPVTEPAGPLVAEPTEDSPSQPPEATGGQPVEALAPLAAAAIEFPYYVSGGTDLGSVHGADIDDVSNDDAEILEYHLGMFELDGAVWTEVAFQRATDSGTVSFGLELNQVPGVRTAGDMTLFLADQGGSRPYAEVYYWQAGGGWGDPQIIPVGLAEADGGSMIVRAAVNVTGVFSATAYDTADCLQAFGLVTLSTYTSHQLKAQHLLDTVDGVHVKTPQECSATLTIDKVEQLASGDQRPGEDWTFTLAADGTLSVPAGAATQVTDAAGRFVVELPVERTDRGGTVTVTETTRDDWFLRGVQCSVNGGPPSAPTLTGSRFSIPGVGNDDRVTCTVTNEQYQPLTASATAAGTYVQPYSWDITKTADTTEEKARPDRGHEFLWTIAAQSALLDPTGAVATSTVTISNPAGGRARTLDGTSILLDGVVPASVTPALAGVTLQPGTSQTFTATWNLDAVPADAARVTVTLPGASGATEVASVATWSARGELDRYAYLSDSFPEFGTPGTNDTTTLDAADHLEGKEYDYSATRGQDVAPGACEAFPNTATLWDNPALTGSPLDTATETVTVCVGVDLDVTKNAESTVTRTYDWSLTKHVVDPETSNLVDAATQAADANNEAGFTYAVTATPEPFSDSDWVLSGSITVTNPNAWAVPLLGVVDVPGLVGDFTEQVCTPVGGPHVVPAATVGGDGTVTAGSLEIPYTCKVTGDLDATAGQTNTVKVTWDPEVAFSEGGTATHTEDVEVDFTVVNQTITVVDDQTAPGQQVELGKVTWDPQGTSTTFRYDLTVDGPVWPSLSVDHPNRAWINELPDKKDDATATVTAEPLVAAVDVTASYDRTYAWTLDKVLTSDNSPARAVPGSGEEFAYAIQVGATSAESGFLATGDVVFTNTNPFPVSLTGVTILLNGRPVTIGPYADMLVDGQPVTADTDLRVPAGGTLRLTFTLVDTDTRPAQPASISATVVGGSPVTASSEFPETTVTEQGRYADLSDTFDEFGPDVELDAADLIDGTDDGLFEYTATRGETLEPDTCDVWSNTATLTPSEGEALEDGVDVTLCTGAGLTITKTVAPSLQRTFDWSLTKHVVDPATSQRVDAATKSADGSNQAGFSYVVTATLGSYADSGWVLTGSITVANPNGWDVPVTIADVPYLGAGAAAVCTLDGGATTVVPADSSLDVGYTCTITGSPDLVDSKNAVTVTWDKEAAHSPTGSASTTVPVGWTLGYVNDTVTVLDDQTDPSAQPVVLGTCAWGDAPCDFRYDLTVDGPVWPSLSVDHPNRAWISELPDEEDDATATVTAEPLVPSVAVEGSYAIDYDWSLEKTLTSGNADAQATPGEGETYGYAIDVRASKTERDYIASASVTLKNTNPFAVSLEGVTVLVNGQEVTLPGDVTVPPNGETTLPFELWSADAAPEGPVTVSAAFGSDAAATGELDFADVTPDETGRYADLTDSFPEFGADPTVSTDAARLDAARVVAGEQQATFAYDARRGTDLEPGQCGEWTNTATLAPADREVPLTGEVVVGLCTGQDLTVDKTVVSSLQRTYDWDIDKYVVDPATGALVDAASVEADGNNQASFTYRVTVTPLPATDSLWVMDGTITVTNPNAWPVDVTAMDLPHLGDAMTCTVSGAGGRTVDAGETAELGYTCSFEGSPRPTGSNEAVVAWDAAEAHSPSGSVATTVAVTEETWDVTIANDVITVVDDETVRGEEHVLGTCSRVTGPCTFEYGLTLPGPAAGDADGSVTYANVAWIDELGSDVPGAPYGDDAEVTETAKPAPPTPTPTPTPTQAGPQTVTGGAVLGSEPWWAVGGLVAAAGLLLGFALRRRREDA